MPAKKTSISDNERVKRIRESAREHEASNDPASFERAFAAVAKPKPQGQKSTLKQDQAK